MGISKDQRSNIESAIGTCLRNKIEEYKPEMTGMSFYRRLPGKERMELYSFLNWFLVNLDVATFEIIACTIAKGKYKDAQHAFNMKGTICKGARSVIQQTINKLSAVSQNPDKPHETEQIRKACMEEVKHSSKTATIGLYVEDCNGNIFLFDVKAVKPYRENFKKYKRTLLEWVAITLGNNPNARVHSLIAIPYNPYEPEPYQRWTAVGMLDLDRELMVGKEFWDFLGGEGTYEDLLDCFEKVGIEMRDEIDNHFKQFEEKLR